MTNIYLIAAVDENMGIGANNDLLWHLPDDFKWFKRHTIGHTVVMGRKTMESLPKALPKRKNLVLSRDENTVEEPFIHIPKIEDVLKLANDEPLFIIGGGMIYNLFLEHCDKIFLTRVHTTKENADTFFPTIERALFNVVYKEHHPKDEKHAYAFDLEIYERK